SADGEPSTCGSARHLRASAQARRQPARGSFHAPPRVATRTALTLEPARVMPPRPLLAHLAGRHAAKRMPRCRMDDREVEMTDEQEERRVEQPVVQRDGARPAEARVPLAEPEQEA